MRDTNLYGADPNRADPNITRHHRFGGMYDIGREIYNSPSGQTRVGGLIGDFYSNVDANTNFENLPQNYEIIKPAIAAGIMDSRAFQDTQNYNQFTDVMQGYGQSAGMMGAAGRQGLTQQQNMLGRMGLGRSAASSAIEGQVRQSVGAQQAGLRTQLYQQQLAARQAGAQQAYANLQAVTSLALGNSPQIQDRGPFPDWMMRQMATVNQLGTISDAANSWNPFGGGQGGGALMGMMG